jgi:hypothetical protein
MVLRLRNSPQRQPQATPAAPRSSTGVGAASAADSGYDRNVTEPTDPLL